MKNKVFLVLFAALLCASGLFAQGNAVNFDGVNDYVLTTGDLGITTAYTAECWFNPSTLSDPESPATNFGRTILSAAYSSGIFPLWVTLLGSNILVRTWTTDTDALISYNAGLTINTWYHIAVSATSGGTTTLYINGAPVASATNPGETSWPDDFFCVGAIRPVRPISILPFGGMIDEVRVWNTIRTPAEILAAYNTSVSPTATGLVGYWNYNELYPATTAYDSALPAQDAGLFQGAYFTYSDAPLPVELSSFTTTITAENFISLIWVTQSETAVAGYYIYRSTDTQLGNAIIVSPMIPAHNSPTQQIYSYTDSDLYASGTYYYWLQNVDLDGSDSFHGPVSAYYNSQGEYSTPEVPQTTELGALYPNPFNPLVFIPYSLDEAAYVNISVYNNRGQLQHKYDLGVKAAGNYTISWDGTDLNGRPVSSGVYQVVMTSGKEVFTRKAVLLK